MGETQIKTGDALLPDLSQNIESITETRPYWVGLLPKAPVESVSVAGICFPKLNERIIKDPNDANKKRRIPVIGAIVHLTRDKLDLIAERLPRTVIRFLEGKDVQEEPGTGQNLGDVHERARRGHLITIPTPEEVRARKERGKPAQQYNPRANDEPAAKWLFAIPCKNLDNPERGESYPETLAVTGLVWSGNEGSDDEQRSTDGSGDPNPVAERSGSTGADSLLC